MQNHPIKFSNKVSDALAELIVKGQYTKIGVLCDENTQAHCLPLISEHLPEHFLIQIESGEQNKNLITCESVWTAMTEANFDRKSLLINLGGGVIGDMGGFIASTFKRGIDFINLPTTLLSQVDASVGGKLGIDFNGLKNHIGLFNQPQCVIIHADFLNTLPRRELYSGFAEVLKHGLIYDEKYWNESINIELSTADWSSIIEKSVQIKNAVVNEDPMEDGLRKILNFGHTIGHAVETHFLDNERLLHGEAIAVGMICEAYLSSKLTGLSELQLNAITASMKGFYQPKKIDKSHFEAIVALTLQDKKNESGAVKFSLLKSIGNCTYDIPVGTPDMLDSLFFFNESIEK